MYLLLISALKKNFFNWKKVNKKIMYGFVKYYNKKKLEQLFVSIENFIGNIHT